MKKLHQLTIKHTKFIIHISITIQSNSLTNPKRSRLRTRTNPRNTKYTVIGLPVDESSPRNQANVDNSTTSPTFAVACVRPGSPLPA
jgi:hypothetical protein